MACSREEEGMTRCVKMEGDPFVTYPSMEAFLSHRLGSLSTSLYPPLKPKGWLKEVNEQEQEYSIFKLTTEEIFYGFEHLANVNGGGGEEEEGDEEDKEEEVGEEYPIFTFTTEEIFYGLEHLATFNGGGGEQDDEEDREEEVREEYFVTHEGVEVGEEYSFTHEGEGEGKPDVDLSYEDCGCLCFLDKYEPVTTSCTFLQPYR